MSLKWKEISLLVEEARPLLEGSTLQRIFQTREVAGGESFIFAGFGERGPWRIWNCLLLDHTCWVFAEEDWQLEASPEPSTFVMVLRKHLIGQRIERVEQIAGERFVAFHFQNGMILFFELLPKKANLLLGEAWNSELREFRCIHSFRQVSLETGALYRLPPPLQKPAAEEIRDFGEKNGPLGFHKLVAKRYWASVERKGFEAFKTSWLRAWRSHAKKVASALENAREDLEQAKQAELYHQRGMALVAHLYELGPKKMPSAKSIELDGIVVPLDPSKSYSENADQCFRKAKKFHRAVAELEERLSKLEQKDAILARIGKTIEACSDEDSLERLTDVFRAEGIPVPQMQTEEKKVSAAKPFLEVESSDGFSIYCGRNQNENRRVTFQESKGNDIWMHVKGLPGAHVVIKGQKNKTIPLSTLLEAAQLCLYYSKIRKGKRAEVDYTHRKFVRAIKGTLAEVTYTGNKTLYVEADPDAVRKIMKST